MTTQEVSKECDRRRAAGLTCNIPFMARAIRYRAKGDMGAIFDGRTKLWLMPDKASKDDIDARIAAWRGQEPGERAQENADNFGERAQEERADASNDAKEPTLDEALRALATLSRKLDGVTRELADARKANAKLQNDLTEAKREASNLQNVVDFKSNTIKTLSAQLEAERAERSKLSEKLGKTMDELNKETTRPLVSALSDAEIKSLAEGAARATLEVVMSKLTNARTAKRTQAAPLPSPQASAPAPVRALDLDTDSTPEAALRELEAHDAPKGTGISGRFGFGSAPAPKAPEAPAPARPPIKQTMPEGATHVTGTCKTCGIFSLVRLDTGSCDPGTCRKAPEAPEAPAPKKAKTWSRAGAIFKKPGGRP